MLHLTRIILICCVVSAPSEGIAVIRRKTYLSNGFCFFDEKVPKVTEISSTSVQHVADEQFFNCVKQKIIHRSSFFYNVFINQYQSRKNNYCSIMDSFLEKRKNISSSLELPYRKRNLLWTQKGLKSLKTLNSTNETSTTTLKPLHKHNLNFIEKKRLLALKKTKTPKKKRVRRCTGRKHPVGKSKNLGEENSFSKPVLQLSKTIDNGYFEKKLLPGRVYPRFHHSKKFICSEKSSDDYVGSVEKKIMQGQVSPVKKGIYNSYIKPNFRNFHSYFSNKHSENARPVGVEYLNEKERLLRSDFKINSNKWEGRKENQNLNEQEKNYYYDNVPHKPISELNKKAAAVPDHLNNEKPFRSKQEIGNFLKKILKAGADYFNGFNEDFHTDAESKNFFPPKFITPKLSSAYSVVKKKIPTIDIDFPDYDEIYDAADDIPLKDYNPSDFRRRPKFKIERKSLPKKRYSKVRQNLRTDSRHKIPLYLRRSFLFQKMERKKKCCCSKCSNSCEMPHKCWKSAPLLCIPYIRKGQDDLLKYLIQIMQKMLTKPYPQKIDIFENIKFKPCIKKITSNSWEDIMPNGADEDDDDDDDCYPSKCKSTAQPCDPCSPSYPPTPQPCPAACPPMPTPCPSSCSINPISCSKNASKNSNNPTCPSFPCTLPNLNQIYSETTPCSSDKCFSTLPDFLFPPSSVLKSTDTKNLLKISNKTHSDSHSAKPTEFSVTLPSAKKDTLVSPNILKDYMPITFFPPKKHSLEYFKKAKKIYTNSFASNDQLQSDQRLNDKILPDLVEYQEELKSLNLSEDTSESALISSSSNAPFLFELSEFYNNEKHSLDFSNPNFTNLFAERDLPGTGEYSNQLFYSKNPINVSPNKIKRKFHGKHSKDRRRRKKLNYKPLPINENYIYRSFAETLPELHDKSQIDKQLNSRQVAKKFNKHKKKKHSKRRKREDDYKVDDFLNYDSYLYDTNLNDEDYNRESLQQLKRKAVNSDVNKLSDDYGWTPLKFEMFSELAKIVTGTEYTDVSSSEYISNTPESNPSDFTVDPPSVTADQLETNLAETTDKSLVFSRELNTRKITTPSVETKQFNTTLKSNESCSNDKTYCKSQSSSTVELQEAHSTKEEKQQDLDEAEDGQMPTTLGIASIAKGPKKQMTKPSPKMYTKIYPDSVPIESERNDTTVMTTTDTAPKRSVLFKTTQAMITPDVRLQLLAVCEGYLEVLKIMQSQNRSLGEDLDSDLSHYCENIISQSFTQQTDSSKYKKQETNLLVPKEKNIFQNNSKKTENSIQQSKSYNSLNFDDPVLKRKLEENKKLEVEKYNSTNDKRNENPATSSLQRKQNTKKGKRKKKEYQGENQEALEDDDEFLKKGMTKEQMELLHLLKKRKRALLNWLFNSKEGQIQPDVEEAEYFDDNDESVRDSFYFGNSSGTVRSRGTKSVRTTTETAPDITKDSVFPVYAKQYGYDKGGELRQVEVLWRKVNEQTHKKEIFKNLSVLALVLASTMAPKIINEDNQFFDVNGYDNEDISGIRTKNENEVGFAAEEPQNINNGSFVKSTARTTETTSHSYGTVTYINKPDPSSIIGIVTNITNKTTTKHPNITQKIAGKINAAKGVVQEYTIEFWNYAVYILPIMFSILFLFCCTCCAMNILNKKKKRRKRKKKKKLESTDEESSSEETDSESKKKKKNKSKKSKSAWNVWKKNSNKTDSDNNDETNSPEKKKSFLRFLKGKKHEKTEEASSAPYSAVPESGGLKEDTQSEAAERKELIALLEELKKIEMENVGEKKEQKSVHVQYMIQDYDESLFKLPEKQKGYSFYTKNFPFSDPEDYEIYKNAELSKLLPYECDYYNKNHEYLRNCDIRRNEGRCERFFKIVRNAGKSDHKFSKKKDTDKDGRFLFNKYKSTDTNYETKEEAFKAKLCDMSHFNLPAGNPKDWLGEMEHYNRQIIKKKHVRLKDDGVLCRL